MDKIKSYTPVTFRIITPVSLVNHSVVIPDVKSVTLW